MPITEIPAKIMESATNLTEKKMEIARDLFVVIYADQIKSMEVEKAIEKYKEIFNLMKDIAPPEKTTHFLKRHEISFFILFFFILFITVVCFSFLFHGYVDSFLNFIHNLSSGSVKAN